ncbi:MAG TPA: hypothetical protein VF311_03650 [Terriglobales bacterium]|jgi:periplasmic protein CpxP/Spy
MLKRFTLAVFLMAIVCSVALAQYSQSTNTEGQNSTSNDAAAHKAQMQKHLEWLGQQLNLTDDQKEKLKPILQDQHKQMKAVRDDTALTQDQKHENMKQIHESTHTQIQAILTPEQQEKFKQLKEEGMERRKEGAKGEGESKQPQ